MNTRVREHDVSLSRGRVSLRPLREEDLDTIVRWNADVEVLFWYDGSPGPHGAEKTRQHWREASHSGHAWIIQYDGSSVGECRLYRQTPPVESIQEGFATEDVRTIEIMIGEKEYWARGIGSCAIRLVTEFAFLSDDADVVCTFDVQARNKRSLGAYQKAGFRIFDTYEAGGQHHALVVTADEFASAKMPPETDA